MKKTKPNLYYQICYMIEQSGKKIKPIKMLTPEELLQHPECLTYSIKHLFKK